MQQLFLARRLLPAVLHFPSPWFLSTRRTYSTRRSGFFTQVIHNIKQELEKSKEVKENVIKFREEAQKLEQSVALKAARQKFNTIESKATKGSEAVKKKLEKMWGCITEVLNDVTKTKLGRKVGQLGRRLNETARGVGESEALRRLSKTAKVIQQEMDNHNTNIRVYRRPEKLRKRMEVSTNHLHDTSKQSLQPNTVATAMELYKDSRIYQSWENFKNNNQHWNRLLALKMQYGESENTLIRTSRTLTDKVSELMGNLFSRTELSETLTELCRIDPRFDAKDFLRFCESEIIPNVLESILRGDLEVLRDWCFESAYSIIAEPIAEAQQAGYRFDSKILDIENIELAMGQVMEQGPVLIVTFQTQQIMWVRDGKGEVVEGNPEMVYRCHHVWVLCRDPSEVNPKAAWRIMQISVNSREQFV